MNQKPKKRITGLLEAINIQFLFEQLPFILFLTILLMLYISLGHRANKKVRQIKKLHLEVKDLKNTFISKQARVIEQTKESVLLQQLKGFEALKKIPLLIEDNDTKSEKTNT